MSAAHLYIDQRQVLLGKQIGKGGEGEVYLIEGDAHHALKLYTLADTADRERKIATMIRAGLAAQVPEVAFPLSVARTPQGRFAGFLMRFVPDHKALHELYSPGSRKLHFPQADYRFIVRTALNIARAVASVHKLGCVIGDINHSSILVSREATVALIDSDSFQIADGPQLFACRVGMPEYTPPELQGIPLSSVQRTANHDAFGLAIVIFQLLFMGRHPFIGTVRRGELPPLPEAIRDFRFVYTESRDVGMDQPPGTPALADFPRSVMEAFEAAFDRETCNRRPSAAAWIASLTELERRLIPCEESSLHWYPGDASDCLWCAMEQELGTSLFPPYIPPQETPIHPFDPGAGGFNLADVWRAIEGFPVAEVLQLAPALKQVSIRPSAAAHAALDRKHWVMCFRVVAGVSALVLAFTASAYVWIPLALFALFGQDGGCKDTVRRLKGEYSDADRRLDEAIAAWRKKAGVEEIAQLLASLQEAKNEYANLGNEERELKAQYHRSRRSRQLNAFLDGFEIRRGRIRGIGPAKQAALASYGIETAADVSLERMLKVPGVGHTCSSELVHWRRRLERRFVYNESYTERDSQELARISSGIQTKASTLRRTLLAGRSNLDHLASRARSFAAIKDPELRPLHTAREQLRADIELLGGSVPVSPPSRPAPAAVRQPSPAVAQPGPAVGQLPPHTRCPKCGSSMVLRHARRGRWAGSQFWGCSRYPICKGTRNL